VKTEQNFLESGILKYNVCVWVMEVMDGWTESETLRERLLTHLKHVSF